MEGIDEDISEMGGPIGLGKFLTHNQMGLLLPNFDKMLLGYTTKYGMNFFQIHHYFPIFMDFYILNHKTSFSPFIPPQSGSPTKKITYMIFIKPEN